MRVLDVTGDTTLSWDPEKPEEVTTARRAFDDLRAKGFGAFRVDSGKRGESLTTFDPSAGQIIVTPALAGG